MTVQAHGVADYDFEDFVQLDHADAVSIFSEDWEDLCSSEVGTSRPTHLSFVMH